MADVKRPACTLLVQLGSYFALLHNDRLRLKRYTEKLFDRAVEVARVTRTATDRLQCSE